MKILVLGVTGRTGYLFTRKALEEGPRHRLRGNPNSITFWGAPKSHYRSEPWTMPNSSPASSGQDVMVSILGQKATVREALSSHAGAPAPHHGGGHGRRR